MKPIRHSSAMLTVLGTLLLAPAGRTAQKSAPNGDYIVYVGTYTGKGSEGIYAWRLQMGSGQLAPLGLAAETTNPSFLAIHPNRRYLYSVSEEGRAGAVSAFSIDAKTGKLTFLNKVSSRGAGPCWVSTDKTGKDVLVANYGSGSVAVLPIKEDGSLTEASAFVQHTGSGPDPNRPNRQRQPHAHSFNVSPDNRFAIAADLGLDKLFVYRFDAVKGSLEPNDPPFAEVPAGAGPRHFAFHPSGKFAYAINEIQSSVTAFSYDGARGVLTSLETVSTLPKDFSGKNTCAEVQVHPSGRFLYGPNRGHDSIAVFAIDARKGTLTPVEQTLTGGKEPRNFGIDPTGRYLFAANQNSGSIVVFQIDQKTGRLKATGQTLEVVRPVCVKFLPVR